MNTIRSFAVAGAACGLFAVGGVVLAAHAFEIETDGDAVLSCPGGMSRLGHVFSADASVFPGDPPPEIEIVFTVPTDGFLVEMVDTGTHTSTHLDAPIHFIDGGRSVDELAAEEFVWPAYVIDVRDRMTGTPADAFQLEVADIRAHEREHGRIPSGAMVIIQTGFDAFFGTPAFLADAPGFSGAAVQWMVDERGVRGVGSDTFGPDWTGDFDFDATYTILANDGVALPGLNNVDSLATVGDIIMAPTVALIDGSGYQVDPLACHGEPDDDDRSDDDRSGRGGAGRP